MKPILIILIALILAAPARAEGIARVAVATCGESVILWDGATAGQGTYAYTVLEVEHHGVPVTVDMYYQYYSTLANGRAVYRAVDWQTMSLQVERITVIGGAVMDAGGKPLQGIDPGGVFVPGCWRVSVPMVVR